MRYILTILIALTMFPASATADLERMDCGDHGPSVYLLPGGGFQTIEPLDPGMRPVCETLADRGLRAHVLGYPVGRYDYRGVRALIPRHAYVVGFSAGAAYALHLASRGWVRHAIAISPPVPAGQVFTRDALRRILGWGLPGSAYGDLPHMPGYRSRRGATPIDIFHDPRDEFADWNATNRWCNQRPRCTMHATEGEITSLYHAQWDHTWIPTLLRTLNA